VGRRERVVVVVERASELRRTLPALIASIPITIVFFAVLGIVLTAAGPNGLDLTDEQTSSWIAVLYGFPTLIALVLTIRYRQPLLITGNIFAIIFFVSLGDQLDFPSWPAPRCSPARSCWRRPSWGSPVGSPRGSPLRS
jgi:predicted benzoate:H+ symporter BenE